MTRAELSEAVVNDDQNRLSLATSLYLDCLRVVAALVVFWSHCVRFWYPDFVPFAEKRAHYAVVVFFVLSGYVIAHSTFSKSQSAKDYIVARLSRLYSVLLPALCLTLVLQLIGTVYNPAYYAQWGSGVSLLRYVLALFFFQNVWMLSASPYTDNPLWSLGYEFWYYVLFGGAVFIQSRAKKWGFLLLVPLVFGFNILLLMPCWILGVAMYCLRNRFQISRRLSALGFAIASIAAVLLVAFMPPVPNGSGHKPLLFSGAFVSDWFVALAVSFSICFFDALFRANTPPPMIRALVRKCSDHTFSLYLYHYPLIVFVTALGLVHPANILETVAIACAVLTATFLLSLFTEARRGSWRTFFQQGCDWFVFTRSRMVAASMLAKNNQN